MKRIVTIVLVIMLSGCTFVKNRANTLDEAIENAKVTLNTPYEFRVNNSSTYFSYYLPSDCQEIESSENASIINFLDSCIVMNLNIPSIINNTFYTDSVFDDDGFFIVENIVHESNGSFIKKDGTESIYYIKVYKENDVYLLQLKTNELIFYANTNLNDIEEVIKHIFLIAQSVETNLNKIITAYSSKEVIDYQKKLVGLFDYIAPTEGYLNDLVNSSNGTITNPEGTNPESETNETIDDEIDEINEEND